MANYYFVGTILPELQIGLEPEIKLDEFLFLLRQNLSVKDFSQIEGVRRYFDIENIRFFWTGQLLNEWSNFDSGSLEEALLTKVGLPSYVYDFMERYESLEKRLDHFSALYVDFFHHEIQLQQGFLKQLLIIERNIRLILAVLRVKKGGRDLLKEFQYEDPEDPLVSQIIAQKDASSYDPPTEYEELKKMFDANCLDPLALHKAILEYRYKKIGELTGLQVFTMDRILAYMFQLILAEKWVVLDHEKGLALVSTILK